ncbi:hypothetical protein V8C26DRAFT_384897 [Trichoderma gracile]
MDRVVVGNATSITCLPYIYECTWLCNPLRRLPMAIEREQRDIPPLHLMSADAQQPSTMYIRAVINSLLASHSKNMFPLKNLPDKPSTVLVTVVHGQSWSYAHWMHCHRSDKPLMADLAVGLSPHDPTRDELSCPRPRSSTPFHPDGPGAMWATVFCLGYHLYYYFPSSQCQGSNSSYMLLLYYHLTLKPSTTVRGIPAMHQSMDQENSSRPPRPSIHPSEAHVAVARVRTRLSLH